MNTKTDVRVLQFLGPTFKEGVNITCRKGIKWADVSGLLEIVKTGDEENPIGIAKVVDVKVIPFDSIYDEMLQNEHSPKCRTWHGLFNVMKETYPNFSDNEIVTLIYFEFI